MDPAAEILTLKKCIQEAACDPVLIPKAACDK
jgi:hypothetical protein